MLKFLHQILAMLSLLARLLRFLRYLCSTYIQELIENRRQELQAKRLQREKEQQENIRQRQMEEIERRAQYAAEMEMKRERSEATLRDRESTIQKVRVVTFPLGLLLVCIKLRVAWD